MLLASALARDAVDGLFRSRPALLTGLVTRGGRLDERLRERHPRALVPIPATQDTRISALRELSLHSRSGTQGISQGAYRPMVLALYTILPYLNNAAAGSGGCARYAETRHSVPEWSDCAEQAHDIEYAQQYRRPEQRENAMLPCVFTDLAACVEGSGRDGPTAVSEMAS